MSRADRHFGISLHPIQDLFFHIDSVVINIGIMRFHLPGQGIDDYGRTDSVGGARWATERMTDMYRRGEFDANDKVWNPRHHFDRWDYLRDQ